MDNYLRQSPEEDQDLFSSHHAFRNDESGSLLHNNSERSHSYYRLSPQGDQGFFSSPLFRNDESGSPLYNNGERSSSYYRLSPQGDQGFFSSPVFRNDESVSLFNNGERSDSYHLQSPEGDQGLFSGINAFRIDESRSLSYNDDERSDNYHVQIPGAGHYALQNYESVLQPHNRDDSSTDFMLSSHGLIQGLVEPVCLNSTTQDPRPRLYNQLRLENLSGLSYRVDAVPNNEYATGSNSSSVLQGAHIVAQSPGAAFPDVSLAMASLPISPESKSTQFLSCNLCESSFNGRYAKGNLRRHRRNVHGYSPCGPRKLPCLVSHCDKLFRREDSRLKHERKCHPGLATKPPIPRKGKRVKDELHPRLVLAREPALELAREPALELAREPVLEPAFPAKSNKKEQSPSPIQKFQDSSTSSPRFFQIWDLALQNLRESRLATSSSSRGARPINQPSSGKIQKSLQTRIKAQKRKLPPEKTLGCPVQKHSIVHSQASPCGGVNAQYMSEVRQHLQPGRSRKHGDFPTFVALCQICNEHVVDENEWTVTHLRGLCSSRPQARGNLATQWRLLYRKLYPDSTKLPSPYNGDNSWTAISGLTQSPFSPDPQSSPSPGRTPTPTREPFLEMQPQDEIQAITPTLRATEQEVQVREAAVLMSLLDSSRRLYTQLLLEAGTMLTHEECQRLADQAEEDFTRNLTQLRAEHGMNKPAVSPQETPSSNGNEPQSTYHIPLQEESPGPAPTRNQDNDWSSMNASAVHPEPMQGVLLGDNWSLMNTAATHPEPMQGRLAGVTATDKATQYVPSRTEGETVLAQYEPQRDPSLSSYLHFTASIQSIDPSHFWEDSTVDHFGGPNLNDCNSSQDSTYGSGSPASFETSWAPPNQNLLYSAYDASLRDSGHEGRRRCMHSGPSSERSESSSLKPPHDSENFPARGFGYLPANIEDV
ncbi:uncharacterized protein BDR25DRAFT_382501 [Lindgomyces ingoldianus]|uniref:Uncharacterized protein n=1 Tax=Lindgomyces ingoldianus TaxID=673940 RepID=A0ACB6R844_9PLEO|nr:uncharacterized protein BDR25DRAFT_382501 [Lindgomyces ingoldianus]KAF2475489.1 hypothetical protein BDR25DRAFT_382501 [Lindgomyces ingoldianus]